MEIDFEQIRDYLALSNSNELQLKFDEAKEAINNGDTVTILYRYSDFPVKGSSSSKIITTYDDIKGVDGLKDSLNALQINLGRVNSIII
jgi:uncharacterized Zn ribbon protein